MKGIPRLQMCTVLLFSCMKSTPKKNHLANLGSKNLGVKNNIINNTPKKSHYLIKTVDMSEHVIKGNRMSISDDFPQEYAELIKKCWKQDPKERPSFKEIIISLEEAFIPLLKKEQ